MKKKCFVVMGFGEKPDYRTQRKLNLDKTYSIIRRAVEGAGLECVRADDIIHSGTIDKPMYELLLEADVVVADLSTSNENAIYELGVRHALKPQTTIVIAEKQFSFPFDLNHVLIRPYEHLGTGIDFDEAVRLQNELTTAIKTLAGTDEVDSPVYTFLHQLDPPCIKGQDKLVDPLIETAAIDQRTGVNKETMSVLLDAFNQAKANSDWVTAKALLENLRRLQPSDHYLIQQHALATYKAKLPDPDVALREAHEIIEQNLSPSTTNDPETLGLWGAIHKRLWELSGDHEDLDKAIWSYERGYYLKRDYYNGINYAYLLNVRAVLQEDRNEAIADFVGANRVRKEVIIIVEGERTKLPKDRNKEPEDKEEAYWLHATKVEALHGLGEEIEKESEMLFQSAMASWMNDTTKQQLDKLTDLIEKGKAKLVDGDAPA